MDISSPLYRKAFNDYLRYGIRIETSLKAAAIAHPTTHYVWRTRADDKVRSSHAANDGVIFAWDDPPPTGHPGTDYHCRCTAEPYNGNLPAGTRLRRPDADLPLEAVYPELLIIPLLRTPRLIQAWREWIADFSRRNTSEQWKLGSHKSEVKWANRLEPSNWTPSKISNVIKKGKRVSTYNAVNKTNPASRYELSDDFLVVDDVTNEILAVSRPNHIPSLKPPLPKSFIYSILL
jgi:hypothetical protein